MADKKELPDWMKGATPVTQNALPDWMAGAKPVTQSEGPSGPSLENLDPNTFAPALVRMEVGALHKPEDRLRALQKTFPDARPYGEDNFLMTDPNSGKTIQYKEDGWRIPSMGDLASITPEFGEGVGAVLGSIGGGAAGATVGSAAPVVGTAAGAVGGAIAGAGTGGATGRDLTERGINYLFGNADTRSTGEYLKDKAIDVGVNAAGEGAGRALVAGAKGASSLVRNTIIGQTDAPAEVAARITAARAGGIEPTVGMVSGSPRAAIIENALSSKLGGGRIKSAQDAAREALFQQAESAVNGVAGATNAAALPVSEQEASRILLDQMGKVKQAGLDESGRLYGDVAAKTQGTAASGTNTSQLLDALKAEKANMGNSAKLTQGPQLNTAIRHAEAVAKDVKNGKADLSTLQNARTEVRYLRDDPATKPFLKSKLNDLHSALTQDMMDTASKAGPDAEQALIDANTHYRTLMDPVTGFGHGSEASKFLDQTADQAHGFLTARTGEGDTRLALLKSQIVKENGQEAWDRSMGTLAEQMGRDGTGAFNPTTLAKNLEKMSPEAKNTAFGAIGTSQRDALENAATNAKMLQRYSKFGNHSNTATHQSVMSELNPLTPGTVAATAFGGVPAALGVLGVKGANVATNGYIAKLLTNPETANLIAKMGQSKVSRGGIGAIYDQLDRLKANTTDKALAQAISSFLIDQQYPSNDGKIGG